MAKRRKGKPTGRRKDRGSFLRSFISDVIDVGQEAIDEFMEREYKRPFSPSSASSFRKKREDSLAAEDLTAIEEKIDDISQKLETLSVMVKKIKMNQKEETQ